MADPVLIDIPADTWTLVATGVTSGMVHKKGAMQSTYLQTYRSTGSPAPTLISEGVEMFLYNEISEEIDASVLIDVYIFVVGSAGRVRVDI